MRKLLGKENQEARQTAIASLALLKNRNVKSLSENDTKELLIAILQLLGLADRDGKIK